MHKIISNCRRQRTQTTPKLFLFFCGRLSYLPHPLPLPLSLSLSHSLSFSAPTANPFKNICGPGCENPDLCLPAAFLCCLLLLFLLSLSLPATWPMPTAERMRTVGQANKNAVDPPQFASGISHNRDA